MNGINGYNRILEEDKNGNKPMYRIKQWRKDSRRLEKQRKKKSWLGTYKDCMFVPPTPGGGLRKQLQAKEIEMRPGGWEDWSIKIIEMAGKTLERVSVKNDPFSGNQCPDPKCLPAKNQKNQISCRTNNSGYIISC